ncbi:ATP-binding protein [Streptomyces tropicalis]|uniref:ATP-binding protein n=1 Tax=Streptomyces tropicalis TaxID=3034234 RepID=A0ABT6A9X2_9ACTN|nr:ATP-binding protein [Streptomyces tropicalis]MDF3301237.1 ATP-binding protein [Streptomyces tropicalis]
MTQDEHMGAEGRAGRTGPGDQARTGGSDGTGPPGGAPSGAAAGGPVTTAATARAFAQAVVRDRWNSSFGRAREEDVIDLLLVVSELVTNAIRHGEGLTGFDAVPTADGIRLAVHDRSDVVPQVAFGPGDLPLGHQGSGYGWPLIIRLAREIVIDRRPGGGKTVTVLVPLRAADTAGGGTGEPAVR